MKTSSFPVATLLLAGSANAMFGGKPPPQPKPHVVGDFLWSDPFQLDSLSSFEADCEAVATMEAYEYTLHDLNNPFPKGLGAWAGGLKTLFGNREYPGSWGGWDRHLSDRSILLMEYSKVPLQVRQWIETEDRTGGPGKGLFGVFEKPVEEDEKVTETVTFPSPAKVEREKDADKVVIFAPGALYHILPLWPAGTSECKDALVDLNRYTTTPAAGQVIAWVENSKPDKKAKTMEFVVKSQLLKSK
ncbi:hypothetical protein B0I35DRAFT_332081, partial [Stachybotrys elegans]